MPTLSGINHITIAVSDLHRSLAFYHETLGFEMRARWDTGAHLCIDGLWLCLTIEPAKPAKDYTHIAFSISKEDFSAWQDRFNKATVKLWKTNRSEGDSLYFLDPDGHKLELHVGDLNSRLAAMHESPYPGQIVTSN